jgi:hypothetical protein
VNQKQQKKVLVLPLMIFMPLMVISIIQKKVLQKHLLDLSADTRLLHLGDNFGEVASLDVVLD